MLEEFCPYLLRYIKDCKLYIIEQADDKPFNRAKLINVGFIEAGEPAFFVSHDIDLLPLGVDYAPRIGVTQMATNPIQIRGYLSGCTMYDCRTFKIAGGYHNDYFHRAEDNEMMFNLIRLGIRVSYNIGKFKEIYHPRSGPEFIPYLWDKAQQPRKIHNQLAVCKYKLMKKKKIEGYHFLSVEL